MIYIRRKSKIFGTGSHAHKSVFWRSPWKCEWGYSGNIQVHITDFQQGPSPNSLQEATWAWERKSLSKVLPLVGRLTTKGRHIYIYQIVIIVGSYRQDDQDIHSRAYTVKHIH